MRNIIFIVLLILLSLVQISCKTNDTKSVLVIAVDELTFGDVTCNEDDMDQSGFQLLCNESVRFTHAFTPSILSVPTLSSILTGLYPYQHKVRNNGGPGLASEIKTVAEVALSKGYRTSFFSGGAPVFRRSGLNQGFEHFEDNIVPSLSSLFRPFSKNAETFYNWVLQEADDDPFFSVIYAPDLIFTTTLTTTDLGEVRNLSFESQLSELNESLYDLFTKLKKAGRWDNTIVILVGLNGHTTSERPQAITALNLHGENTQVALFIKPLQEKKRDQPIHWKVDQNVTLVDIGRTLIEHFTGNKIDNKSEASFPIQSLLGVLKTPNPDWIPERPILIESGWAQWRKAGPIKTATISEHVLLLNDESPKLFNTLVDRFEINPLPLLQESILPTTKRLQALTLKNQFPSFPPIDKEWRAKLSISYSRWMRPDQESQLLNDLQRLAINNPRSIDLINWTAQIALNQKDWELLRQLGLKNNVSNWQYVGETNLNIKNAKVSDPCFILLNQKYLETDQLKTCSDGLFLELIDWLRADMRGLNKETQRIRFERSFRNYMLDQYIQRANIATGLLWDTSRENSFAPSRTELALALPEYSRQKNQIYKLLFVKSEP